MFEDLAYTEYVLVCIYWTLPFKIYLWCMVIIVTLSQVRYLSRNFFCFGQSGTGKALLPTCYVLFKICIIQCSCVSEYRIVSFFTKPILKAPSAVGTKLFSGCKYPEDNSLSARAHACECNMLREGAVCPGSAITWCQASTKHPLPQWH